MFKCDIDTLVITWPFSSNNIKKLWEMVWKVGITHHTTNPKTVRFAYPLLASVYTLLYSCNYSCE